MTSTTLPAYPAGMPADLLDHPLLGKVWEALTGYTDSEDAEDVLANMCSHDSTLDRHADFSWVADALVDGGQFPALSWSLLCDSSGACGGADVGVWLAPQRASLTRMLDSGITYDRSAKGAAAAVCYGLKIADVYTAMVAAATRTIHTLTVLIDGQLAAQEAATSPEGLSGLLRDTAVLNTHGHDGPEGFAAMTDAEIVAWLADEGIDVHLATVQVDPFA